MNKTALDSILKTVKYPGFSRDIVSFGLVKGHSLKDGHATVDLQLTSKDPEIAKKIKASIEAACALSPEVDSVTVNSQVSAPPSPGEQGAQPSRIEGVRHVIAIASGKGGVGKSTVTTNIACATEQLLAEQGMPGRVGIMDCDIYGPSIPMMLGIGTEPEIEDNALIPPENYDVRCMSMGYFLGPNAPVVWRGPRIHQTIQQFITNVAWGDLEVLFVDLPPGTGDAHLSLCQSLALDGVVVVTTPQAAAVNVAIRGAMMFPEMNVPFAGVAENMSYLEDPVTSKKQYIFGQGGGAHTAMNLDCDFLGQIPLDGNVRAGGDSGIPIVISEPDTTTAFAFRSIASQVLGFLQRSETTSSR
ncbi:MAG: P-loop NTPase [Opitutales bacterium]